MRQLYVAFDERRERHVISSVDNVIIDWDDDHWSAVAWVVSGRTDTDFEKLQSKSVCFYTNTDAEIARQAIQLHEQFIDETKKLHKVGEDENERRKARGMDKGAHNS